jgi:hypothetical protein
LFRRRVRVDRKSGAVKILGQVFKAQKHDERYNVRDGENLLEALGSVRFEELPDNVVFRVSPRIPQRFEAFGRPVIRVTREGLEAFLGVDEHASTLVEPAELADGLQAALRNAGFEVKADNMYSYSAKYGAGGGELVGEVVQGLIAAVIHFSNTASERERVLQSVVDGWVSRVGGVDGRQLAYRRDVYGVARWLTTPLTSQDIAYILFYLEPASFNLNERIAEAIVGRVVDRMNETENRLKRLGLLTIEGNFLDYSWACSALKQLLEKILSGETAPSRRGLEPRYDPVALLYYIGRNFAPLALQMSGKLRGNRRGLQRYVEKMMKELNFIHVAVVTSIQMNIEVPKPVLVDTMEAIVRLGFVSHRMKIKPFGKWLATLTKGYVRKAGILKNPGDWEKILNWHSLTDSIPKQ